MASVVRRTRKDGSPSYFVKYVAGDGRQRWEHVPSGAKAARARKAEVELELAKTGGRWTPPADITFGDYANRWLDTHGRSLRPQTVAEYRRILDRELLPRFDAIPLAAITRSAVKDYAAAKAASGVASNTVRNVIAVMRNVLAAAVDDEKLRANPAARIKRTGRPARHIQPPTMAQVAALLIHARTPEARAVFALAASLGLRRGELFALTWSCVGKDTVRVEASNDDGTITRTKTDAGRRDVPLFASARKTLAEHKLRSPSTRPDDFVFPNELGLPEHPARYCEREFQAALEAAGMARRAFRFHDLRHFAVSQLIAQGANILQLARVAGHRDPSVTLRVYAHLMADGLAQAARDYDPLRAARPA